MAWVPEKRARSAGVTPSTSRSCASTMSVALRRAGTGRIEQLQLAAVAVAEDHGPVAQAVVEGRGVAGAVELDPVPHAVELRDLVRQPVLGLVGLERDDPRRGENAGEAHHVVAVRGADVDDDGGRRSDDLLDGGVQLLLEAAEQLRREQVDPLERVVGIAQARERPGLNLVAEAVADTAVRPLGGKQALVVEARLELGDALVSAAPTRSGRAAGQRPSPAQP